jgi:hypothetical protein
MDLESVNQTAQVKKEKHVTALKWILVVGLIVVLNLFFNFAIQLVYDQPEYIDFCEEKQVKVQPQTQEECLAEGGAWTEDPYYEKERAVTPALEPIVRQGYCDADFTCRQEFDDARSVYNRNVFVVLAILGVASILAGIFITVSSVSLGLSLGGVLSLIIASIRYWSDMDEILRVIILAVALIALIWVGIKKLRD